MKTGDWEQLQSYYRRINSKVEIRAVPQVIGIQVERDGVFPGPIHRYNSRITLYTLGFLYRVFPQVIQNQLQRQFRSFTRVIIYDSSQTADSDIFFLFENIIQFLSNNKMAANGHELYTLQIPFNSDRMQREKLHVYRYKIVLIL